MAEIVYQRSFIHKHLNPAPFLPTIHSQIDLITKNICSDRSNVLWNSLRWYWIRYVFPYRVDLFIVQNKRSKRRIAVTINLPSIEKTLMVNTNVTYADIA